MKTRGPETERSHKSRIESGFYSKYMTGKGVDIGYGLEYLPVLDTATGFDVGTPGYDGFHLPFENESLDYVFSSHCIEHLDFAENYIHHWWGKIKIGGHLVIMVPHKFLYEKKENLPSLYNGDHKHFWTPGRLLTFIEQSCWLKPNSYRVVHLRDNDDGYDYSIPPEKHCGGCCEIELVLKKIVKPEWDIK